MAARVTVTKGEEAAMRYAHAMLEVMATKTTKEHLKHIANLEKFITKVDNYAAIPAASGLGFAAFHKIMKEVLGSRLAMPPNPAASWYATQTNRIKATGINEEQARQVAIGARDNIRFPTIAFDLLTARITSLLSQGQQIQERKSNAGRETPSGFGREEDPF